MSAPIPPKAERPWLASFGRRRGRGLTPEKKVLLETLLPRLEVRLPGDEMYSENQPKALANAWGDMCLEIGFGGGEHLAEQASRHPNTLCIGCEPYIDGVARLLEDVEARGVENVRIFPEDARLVLQELPDASLSQMFILFPDPWPKGRHHKRRIVSHDTLDMIARVLKPGCQLRLATDHADYSIWMLEQLLTHDAFEWIAEKQTDWHEPPEDWVTTRYETKTRAEGREPVYYRFLRR